MSFFGFYVTFCQSVVIYCIDSFVARIFRSILKISWRLKPSCLKKRDTGKWKRIQLMREMAIHAESKIRETAVNK